MRNRTWPRYGITTNLIIFRTTRCFFDQFSVCSNLRSRKNTGSSSGSDLWKNPDPTLENNPDPNFVFFFDMKVNINDIILLYFKSARSDQIQIRPYYKKPYPDSILFQKSDLDPTNTFGSRKTRILTLQKWYNICSGKSRG